MSWRNDLALVAGADLSSQQYKFVGATGVLATSQTNPVGVIQNKPESTQHVAYAKQGRTKLYMCHSVGDGAWIGQSNTTSGAGAIITPPGYVWGITAKGCNSGGLARVDLFSEPIFVGDIPFDRENLADITSTHSSTNAGAYRFATYGGTLAGSETDAIAGITRAAVASGSTGGVIRRGRSNLYMAVSAGIGSFIGQSNATSGAGAIVTSGGHAWGIVATYGASGTTNAVVDLFAGPSYIAL
jgi:hypothetical protein